MPPDRYPPSYSDTPAPGACPQARHKPLSSPTAVPRVRSCPCRITLHLSAKSPFHGPEAIQRTTSTASRCKRDSAALRTAAKRADKDLLAIYLYTMERFGQDQAERYTHDIKECFELCIQSTHGARC